jgi:hypothetical protein
MTTLESRVRLSHCGLSRSLTATPPLPRLEATDFNREVFRCLNNLRTNFAHRAAEEFLR